MYARTLTCLLLALTALGVFGVDLSNSEITVVTDATRYRTQHPEADFVVFNKARHVKGNYVFTSGERISGDHLVLTFLDEIQYTKSEDIEVVLKYPAKTQEGATLTAVEIYVDLSSDDADAFFVGGGIDYAYADILLTCNKTLHYTYEIFIYGY